MHLHAAGAEEALADHAVALATASDATFASVAARGHFDPWLVVDDLHRRGDTSVAVRYAGVVAPPQADRLRVYAGAAPRVPKATREAIAEAIAAVARGDPKAAVTALDRARAPSVSVPGIRALQARGQALLLCEDARKAEQVFAEAATAARELGWVRGEADSLADGVRALYLLVDYGRALDASARLAELQRKLGDALDAARTEADVGACLVQLAAPTRALPYLKGALETLSANGEERDAARVRLTLAQALALRGDYSGALALAEAAVTTLAELADSEWLFSARQELGNLHAVLGDYTAALACFERALADASGDTPEARFARADLSGSIGRVLGALGRTAKALERLNRARAEFDALGDRSSAARTLLAIGHAHLRDGRAKEATLSFREAVALAVDDPSVQAQAYHSLGEGLLAGSPAHPPEILAQAGEAYALAAELADVVEDMDLHVVVEEGLGRLALLRNEPGDAWKHARRALDLLDRMTTGLSQGDEILARGEEYRSRLFATAVSCALPLGDDSVLCEALERCRAAALVRAMGGRAALAAAHLPPALAEAEERARCDLVVSHERQREARASGEVAAIREAAKAVEASEEALASLRRRIEREAQTGLKAAEAHASSLAEIQEVLAADETLVLYALLPETVWALVVDREGARRVRIEDPRSLCTSLAANRANSGAKEWEGPLRGLRERLVEPLRLGPGVRKLLVSPDGPLALLPWTLLVGDRIDVALVPSGSTVKALAARGRRSGKAVLAIGDPQYDSPSGDRGRRVFAGGMTLPPLPHTRREVERVTTAGEDVRLLGPEACESRLREALRSRPSWYAVHIASHAFVHPRNPSLSALALTPTREDDGFLTALEVSALGIESDLVVLSACDTGRGSNATGEGLLGLARAFLLAGARQVVVSLWRVDDAATCELMSRLYEEARSGAPVATALRRAQKHVRDLRPEWASPHYWGGWVVWGLPQ